MPAKDHKNEMIAMREAGKTYREIAEHFGISKQWVHIIIAEACNCEDPARKCSVDIEKIVYEGIYELFANDYKMTITKFARIAFGLKRIESFHKEKIRRLIYNYGEASLTLRQIRNICEYIGEPFEYVFKVRG